MKKHHFSSEMTRKETILGLCYLPFYLILLSLALELLLHLILQRSPDSAELNACYYCINLLAILLIFRRFLLKNIHFTHWKRTLATVPLALGVYFAISLLTSSIILLIDPNFANQNNNAIMSILDSDPVFVFIMAVLMAPVIEESLFRGLIFGNLCRVNRLLAYLITILAFASIHIVGYLGTMSPVDVLLSVLQYVPAGIVLCAVYQLTDSILTPMLLHGCINLIAYLVMGSLA